VISYKLYAAEVYIALVLLWTTPYYLDHLQQSMVAL